jgi:subtilisin family serine protease
VIFSGGVLAGLSIEGGRSDQGALRAAERDSEAAEAAVVRAGGTVRFRYRAALIGFSAILPPNVDPRRLLALNFASGRPIIARNWEADSGIEPSNDAGSPAAPAPVAALAPSAFMASLPKPLGLDRLGQRLIGPNPLNSLNNQYNPSPIDPHAQAYVLDTGVFAGHSDFRAVASGTHVIEGKDEVGGTIQPSCRVHGSRVAGIIGGATYGVAGGATLRSVRVIKCDRKVDLAAAIDGVNWVTADYLAGKPGFSAAANMSLDFDRIHGSDEWRTSLDVLELAIHNSVAAGITYVVAAGNEGMDVKDVTPARMADVIAVGSTEGRTDTKAANSNVGPDLDIFAPGMFIRSVGVESDIASSIDSGTSFAAPHVTGVALIILSKHLAWSPSQVRAAIFYAATNKSNTSAWCGIGNLPKSTPNILLHWGTLGDDGVKDGEPAPKPAMTCNVP